MTRVRERGPVRHSHSALSSESKASSSNEAFTLIELLVVIAIILIMFVMAYGGAQQSFQERQLVACRNNLQLIDLALSIYAADFHNAYPFVHPAATAEVPLSLLIPRYTADTASFVCPGSRDRSLPQAQEFTRRKISYAYYLGRTSRDGADAMLISDEQVDAQPRRSGQLLFSPNGKRPGNNHRQFGGNLLFVDGHVEAFPSVAPRELWFASPVVLINPKP